MTLDRSSARVRGSHWYYSTRWRDKTKIAKITTKTIDRSNPWLIFDRLTTPNSLEGFFFNIKGLTY